ncbi:MAG: type II toxin-antitoxin system RelE/ParE family toxin [Candidatus Taylorbacteria bacterium]|nr:type II toxin-antitoxin system RelE/ParE family toxin [Candidatus Taylorbacteria bacterium]
MEIYFWNEKINRFIEDLDDLTITHIRHCLLLLREHGHLLEMPDSKALGKGLFELRTQGKVKVRILYIFHKDKAYLIHGFVKKAWKISLRDIAYARKIQKEIVRLA